jgi:hypothetical protein
MAGTEKTVGSSMESKIIWQKIDNANTRKWKLTTRFVDKECVGLNGFLEADAKMLEVESYTNVTNTSSAPSGGNLWTVKFTITQETWENLGRYIGGIYQGA